MIFISESPLILAETFASEFKNICDAVILQKGKINIAISGGNTPKLLFEVFAKDYKNELDWEKVNFYWADERCVDPGSDESNFGMTQKILFDKINIPEINIHRIHGENDPVTETIRYSEVIKNNLKISNGFPEFDLILLGMGDDGHTASIFPDQMVLFKSEDVCAVAVHPVGKQKRITLTGKVINNADKIYFLITGKSKAVVVSNIIEKKNGYRKFPAANILTNNIYPIWYLDENAAMQLKK